MQNGQVQYNVISRIRIRQKQNRILTNTLSQQQLEKIYQDYMDLPEWEQRTKTAKLLHQRNIVILGLLVYQGVTSGELAKLVKSHVNLNEGKIYIPSTRKSNGRHLKLQAGQVMAIQEYLDNYLPQSGQTEESWLFPRQKA